MQIIQKMKSGQYIFHRYYRTKTSRLKPYYTTKNNREINTTNKNQIKEKTREYHSNKKNGS